MTQISILGCGWLGLPLAKSLKQKDFDVKGSTTSTDKKASLETVGIKHYAIALETNTVQDSVPSFLDGSEVLIIAIPPKLRGKNKDYSDANKNSFVKKIQNLIPFIENSTVDKVVFISSTAVYGEANATLDEDAVAMPVTESGKQLLEIENMLLANTNLQTTIIRFGGLIGPDRNPARFLAGKENLPNPDAAVNLIHLDDCIGVIEAIMAQEYWNAVVNAVAPQHPSRKEYYTQKAIQEGLQPPTFDEETPSIGKIIGSNILTHKLQYSFTQPLL
ncbi:NAD(P)-dependent oxidoreductase [Flavobacterium faecale]|uniref:NAD(P)-dependent oxidoreductase n=1 Tax=Flavobacterium faecale TaxID=1355330 RepID=A0A2S1LAC3_9FLAO|nr:SDR family oxidoreductase [Flavobacterium faecale]AWG20699.1 NAD(P)-dependent oxidoreductase [Flavobacterium faecale]